MKNVQSYKVTLKTLGPVHVGDGQKIGKKEYIYDPIAKRYYIPDIGKLFKELSERKLLQSYEDYLLNDKRENGFFKWLKESKLLLPGKKPEWASYSMSCNDIEVENLDDILTFFKDPYGNAYVPGSSIKGMLRTVILSDCVFSSYQNSKKYLEDYRREMKNANDSNILKTAKRIAGDLENIFLRTLNRDKKYSDNAVNDIMSGFIVRDSEPINAENLVLCQKIDLINDGKQNTLPIMFECLPPGIEIKFDLIINPQIFEYNKESLSDFVKTSSSVYNFYFRNTFPPVEKTNKYKKVIYLGGNAGFPTKTLDYSLLVYNAVKPVSKILEARTPRNHNHYHDIDPSRERKDGKSWGVSPHTLKCTKYNGALYEMGLCSIDFQEQG